MVIPHITLVHRRPDIYPDPLAFRPERFLDPRGRDLHLDPVRRRRQTLPRRRFPGRRGTITLERHPLPTTIESHAAAHAHAPAT
jgi:cytochrome P450